jgi:integrase
MASLRKFKASRFWFAVYRDAQNNQCNRSTKIAYAGEGDTERARGRDAAEKRKLAQRIADTYEQTERGHPTEQHVQKVLLDIFKKVNGRRLEPAVTETFFRSWLDRVKARRGEGGTFARYEKIVDRFLDGLGPRRGTQLIDLTHDDFQAFVDAQTQAGKAPATVRIEQKVLNAAMNEARKQGLIEHNPAAAVGVPVEAGESRLPFEWSQVRAILARAKGEWRTVILLGVFTGARLGDCVAMRWKNVDLAARLIRFRPSKTKAKGGEMVVPLHPALEAHLLSLPMPDGAGAADAPLAPKLAKLGIGGRSGLSRQFQKLIDEAGVENEVARQGKGEGRTFNRYGFHSLRHTFNTVLMNQGVAQELRMKLSGHASEAMNARYSHAELETLRAAVAKLPGISS